MSTRHPYQSLPDHGFWRKSIGDVDPDQVDPVVRSAFLIAKTDKVVTAGSCFAQHIAKRLARSGFNYFVTEAAHPVVAAAADESYSYGLFSARYGNVYTARQLVQLLHRAYGIFQPLEKTWRSSRGGFIDPFRPQVQPNGFISEAELLGDRDQHLAAVRQAIEELDVFVFTLGLTEAWLSDEDGAVFPVCPGVAGGVFDPERYKFVNFGVAAVADDMRSAIEFIRQKNPAARFILTVSPVPLIATVEDRSVLVSTTYSKSVLRVAADMMEREFADVAYFPSYEVITGSFSRGAYFAGDLRSITEAGVDHVMRLFMRHYAVGSDSAAKPGPSPAPAPIPASHQRTMEEIAQALCDEELLDGDWQLRRRDAAKTA